MVGGASALLASSLYLGTKGRKGYSLENWKPKLISKVAVDCLGEALVLGLHHNHPAPIIGKKQ